MQANRRWISWVAIGLGAVALLVALAGRGFAPQMAVGFGGASRQQPYGQSDTAQQGRPAAAAADSQPGAGQQPAGAGANAQRGGRPERNGGFGWFSLPFKMIGESFKTGMLVLLVLLGVWLIRERRAGGAASSRSAAPAQGPQPEPQSPTGESYTDELSERE